MRTRLTSLGLVLFLLAYLSSSSGCALFGKDYTVVGTEPCPMMTYEAMSEYEAAAEYMPNFMVWVGQMILYCEKQESRLE